MDPRGIRELGPALPPVRVRSLCAGPTPRACGLRGGRPLPAEITHLTGLTDDDVRGEVIDVEAASALIEGSGLIVAHNARFDRPFVERVLPAARARPWACTRAEVPWTAEGFASQALHCLLCAYGVYARDRHRALADCEAGVWLLA